MPQYVGQPHYTNGRSPRLGVLLVNLGTPDAPTAGALRPYLRQFLSDPRVIEWPRWLWLPVLHGIILNVRPRRSARLYAKIWTNEGSPLLVFSRRLAAKLQTALAVDDEAIHVALGMRYGNPSIGAALAELEQDDVQRILVLPLYPQYSATTTATIFDELFAVLQRWRWVPEIRTVNRYYRHPLYIEAVADSIRRFWEENGRSERLLLSFHGIPESYVQRGDPYRQHCQETAQLVTGQLDLDEDEWAMTFQSRFGPETWLQPYTGETLTEWAQAGVGSVDTVCPGFATDCLETLEEMAEENREVFLEAGGSGYQYIPALNDSSAHVALLADVIRQHVQGWC